MLRLFKIIRRKTKIKRKPAASYLLHKETARNLITSRLAYFNQYYQLTYNRVAIRDQRRCWGSCSSKGNLNFSYKLLFLPPCLRDYIIVHELAHLRVLNHSATFWLAVCERMPDALARAAALRQLEKTSGTGVRTLHALVHDASSCMFCQVDTGFSSLKSAGLSTVEIFSTTERSKV